MRSRTALLLIFFLDFLLIFYLMVNHRIVLHDTFFAFYSQYFFMNHAVFNGDMALWSPYMAHGTTTGFWYIIQGIGGIFLNALFMIAPLFKNFNFLSIYYVVIFFEKCILILGTWLLAKQYFSRWETLFFVTVSVTASTIWMTEIYFTLHLIYALPLILYFLHRFINSGQWRYIFFSANLFVVQAFDKVAYLQSVIALIITLYVFYYVLGHYSVLKEKLSRIRFNKNAFWCLVGAVVSFLFLYSAYKIGLDEPNLASSFVGRAENRAVSLETFMTYALNPTSESFKWLELFLGFSINRDTTLYLGILFIPFCLMGIFSYRNRMQSVLLLLILTIVLISLGTLVSKFFYYTWPGMSYFRHLPLLTPFVKFFLCLLAGFGFERLLLELDKDEISKSFRIILMLIVGLMLSFAVAIFWNYKNESFFKTYCDYVSVTNQELYMSWIRHFPLAMMMSGVKFACLALFFLSIIVKKMTRFRIILIVGVLAFHLTDIYGYAFQELKMRTVPLPDKVYQLSKFTPLPFTKNRTKTFVENGNERESIIQYVNAWNASHYLIMNTYTFNDQLGSNAKTEYWQKPLGDYLDVFSEHDGSIQGDHAWFQLNSIQFPDNETALTYSGYLADKIQFFTFAEPVLSQTEFAEAIKLPNASKDRLFISTQNNNVRDPLIFSKIQNINLENSRLNVDYDVQKFNANQAQIHVMVPGNQFIWMMYSDVWHPGWTAKIDGRATEIFKANVAYKAVKLHPGPNLVEFNFSSPALTLMFKILSLLSLLWVFIFIFMLKAELTNLKHDE